MPFVQRVVQPVYLARPRSVPQQQTEPASGSVCGVTKFRCIPGSKCNSNNNHNDYVAQEPERDGSVARTISSESNSSPFRTSPAKTKTVAALVHQPAATDTVDFANGTLEQHVSLSLSRSLTHSHSHTNGFAASFSYATDNEDEPPPHLKLGVGDGSASALLPMKKLKQHVEFLSTASPSSSSASSSARTGGYLVARGVVDVGVQQAASSHQRRQQQQQQLRAQHAAAAAAKIVPGYEFDSISNITLSNALRQLASLVLLASDIFDELHQELQHIGDRSCAVQRKIIAVEKKVCAFDPKMVTVPESDLLTFAQRKAHYDSDKSVRKELFTVETRPRSLKVLYEDAGKASPPPPTTTATASASFASNTHDGGGVVANESGTGAPPAAGSDELVCTPVFGKANRKMRTRIDAEIEIRLPAAIEDLRKWTSSEALGDVTVTPDCMHHVDTLISTSLAIGDNGVLTPALSPSVLSADAVDALYSINISTGHDQYSQIPNDINKDVPLNHRLPSPEEQIKIIALRYPAEVVSVDTSGKRFQRMCLARKSTTGCGGLIIADSNNLNDDVQTVSRRSRSRKVRGKRRNTIAGTDQKEIQDAANGDSTATSSEIKNSLAAGDADALEEDGAELEERRSAEKSKKFARSKSSDVLKKESVALPYDKGKNTLTRLNSLKLWGRNRFRFMQRTGDSTAPPTTPNASSVDASSVGAPNAPADNKSVPPVCVMGADKEGRQVVAALNGGRESGDASEIDSGCSSRPRMGQQSEGRFSHERKPSYSSSEKSITVSSSGHLKGKLHLATCGANVKLRDTSSLNRQRRNGITANDLTGKEEQPHSSSGNWSASSESGRASIGSEITIQPKSSASNTSLNASSFHPGSGPPSSMLSRRRFLNTSASSSVTSEGTATPDLPGPPACDSYNNHLDDETSSAYSCDTEGYYTSFHMDSGLRTLKEEEPPITPLQSSQMGSYAFGNQANQTVLSAENEYELYGRGSTSTTTSSAGTVCTTLMVNDQNNLNAAVLGPEVPERSSSLNSAGGGGGGAGGKLNRSNHSNSTSTLERSYSSSTIGSTLERTGTIKRNINANLKLAADEVDGANVTRGLIAATPESQDEELEMVCRMQKRSAQPLPLPPNNAVLAELECSESSDLEGVERIERIKQKTAINAKRIPSMCIITPTTSDDENQAKDSRAYEPNRTARSESSPCAKAGETAALQFTMNEVTGYCTIEMGGPPVEARERASCVATPQKATEQVPAPLPPAHQHKDYNLNVLPKRATQYGFNQMLEKLKVVLPNIKRSPSKSSSQSPSCSAAVYDDDDDDDELYDTAGEYVTIADISNNNNRHSRQQQPKAAASSGLGIYYSNDIVRRPKPADDSAPEEDRTTYEPRREETLEYISLNELPQHLRRIAINDDAPCATDSQEVCRQKSTTFIPSSSRQSNRIRECADSDSGQSVPMYAEITEQLERPPISPVAQNKGARIRLNAQGRIIYDSDSLKRRRGAYTTFAPGPYVKETESATSAVAVEADAVHTRSESGHGQNSNAAKLLLLNAAGVATRQIANVRPIVTTASRDSTGTTTSKSSVPSRPPVPPAVPYNSNYMDTNNVLISRANLAAIQAGAESSMLPSPSTKSTSSTGSSTISSANSTNTLVSTSSSASSSSVPSSMTSAKEEASQLSYKSSSNQRMLLQRNSPVYWTLQNRKQPRNATADVTTCRDDLYATPIRRSERAARAAATVVAANKAANISPIVPRNRSSSVGFLTSTPNRSEEQQLQQSTEDCSLVGKARAGRASNRDWDDSPERLNTCADRIGHSKTSLMDFKKLLLAKSVRSSPVQKKLSAVELLKKSTAPNTNGVTGLAGTTAGDNIVAPPSITNATTSSALNSSMKVLDLSGSPKTFANRRMLRQGQFGSPSKSFSPKQRISAGGGGWRGHNVVQRTDIMSTTIPEVNSEEDQSSANSSGSKSQSSSMQPDDEAAMEQRLQTTAADKFSRKHNFFLQTEENNFMRGELKKQYAKAAALTSTAPDANVNDANKLYATAAPLLTNSFMAKSSASPSSVLLANPEAYVNTGTFANKVTAGAAHAGGRITPALETAL